MKANFECFGIFPLFQVDSGIKSNNLLQSKKDAITNRRGKLQFVEELRNTPLGVK